MKNPMIEESINTELFEAIDANEVNGGKTQITTVIDKALTYFFGCSCFPWKF